MKFLKSNLAQKLIIILIALLIFNIAIPPEVKAWDIAGILMKPITSLIVSMLISVDVTIGFFLTGLSAAVDTVGAMVEVFTEDDGAALGRLNSAQKKIFIGPDTIFSGEVLMLNANIFKNVAMEDRNDMLAALSDATQPGYHIVVKVRQSIANIYYTLRNICGYIMLAGLIFTGIRILVSANVPTKRGQYLNLLQDWLIGMIILIFSHIIMIGIFYVSDTLTDALALSTMGVGSLNLTLAKQCLSSWDSAEQIIYMVMLGYLIYLTVIFAIAYFKRFLWVCILIVFAPVVSIMYAFGQQTKQIYSRWFREYIMTVFVQPFHMIVYWVLVSIPLDVVNSTGNFKGLGGLGLFEIIYALVAMSFIRPAEAYMRQLFGMHQGLANMASYDSGKQTFDAVADAVRKMVQFSISPGMAALKGEVPFVSKEKNQQLASVTKIGLDVAGTAVGVPGLGTMASGIAGGTGGTGGETSFGSDPDLLNAGMPHEEIYGGASRDPFHDDYFAGDENFDNDLQNPSTPTPNMMNDDELNNFLDGMGLEGDERAEQERELRALGHGNNQEDGDLSSKSESTARATAEANIEEGTSSENKNGDEIHASSITVVGGNIEIKDAKSQNEEVNNENSDKIETKENTEEENNADKKEENEKEGVNDEDFEIEDGKPKKKNILEHGKEYLDRNVDRMKTFNQVVEGKANPFSIAKDFLGKADEFAHSKTGRIISPLSAPLGDALGKTKRGQKAKEMLKNGLDKAEEFHELGGTTELYKGLNSIRDTFFATPAPQDWKHTVAEREQNQKKKDERVEYNFTHDEGNKNFMFENMKINGQSVMEYYRDVYKGKGEPYIRDQAEKRVESELEKMKGYARYGFNAEQAYPIYKSHKGMSADDALREVYMEHRGERGFNKFDSSEINVNIINEKFGENVSSVSEAIPAAKEYYNNGYRDVQGMLNVQSIQNKLQTSLDMAMKIERALSSKGKANYNGKDEEVKKIFDEINKYYESNKKKKR